MKQLVISCSLFFLILFGNQALAQDSKMKAKTDKTKVKQDDDKTKVKVDDDDDVMKVKDGEYKGKVKDDKIKMKDDNTKVKIKGPDGMIPDYPYTPTYSSNFIIGNQGHAKMVLDLWKDWDDNAFDRHDYFADTLVVYMPDGSFTKGKAANLEGAKRHRGSMASAKSTIHAWAPLRSADRNEDWVAIWGTEVDTWPDGKTETKEIHEIWRINKDGKIDLMRQFTAAPTKQQ